MEDDFLKAAFIRGINKRASELGLEKSAILGAILGGLTRIGGTVLTDVGARKGLAALAKLRKRQGILGRIGRAVAPMHAKMISRSPGLAGTTNNMLLMTGSGLLADPLISPIASKIESMDNRHDYSSPNETNYAQLL